MLTNIRLHTTHSGRTVLVDPMKIESVIQVTYKDPPNGQPFVVRPGSKIRMDSGDYGVVAETPEEIVALIDQSGISQEREFLRDAFGEHTQAAGPVDDEAGQEGA